MRSVTNAEEVIFKIPDERKRGKRSRYENLLDHRYITVFCVRFSINNPGTREKYIMEIYLVFRSDSINGRADFANY
jgi:hypothetical protein